MNKAERKQTLRTIEAHLQKGITENSQHHISEAYRFLEDLLGDVGLFRITEFPKFPPQQSIPDITVETKLQFDIYFGKGKVGKGCTFGTLIKRISAQSSFVDELISENEELHKKLSTPSKREILNKMLNAAPTNTEVGNA